MARTEHFGSFFSSLMATAGLAIGLGNVWRFPYMMGSYGGSAFLILFIVCILFLSFPALMAEWALARETRQGTVGAFKATFGTLYGRIVGYSLLLCITIAGGYYLAVIANVFYSSYFSIVYGYSNITTSDFQQGLGNTYLQYLIAIVILLFSVIVIHRGIKRGVEMVSNLFVPFFFIVSIYLAVKVFTIPGTMTHLVAFLEPDFSKIGFKEVFAAMGQAYFSIGLGATLTLVYGSYMKDEIRFPKLAMMTCLSDTGAALLTAFYLIPALLVFGLALDSGPDLLFNTLPRLLEVLPGGRLFGSLMLLSLALVTFLSYVAVLEAVIGSLISDNDGLNKKSLLIIMTCIQAVLLIPFSLYPGIIPVVDLIFGSAGLMAGGCLALIALGWGIGKEKTIRQVFGNNTGFVASIYFFWIKWVVPLILIVVLIGTVYEALIN